MMNKRKSIACQHGNPADTCDTSCKCGHECRHHYSIKFRKYSNVGACDKCKTCYEFNGEDDSAP